MKRLRLPTLRIDASRKLTFTYRGKTLEGVDGDTVATALFANGVRIFSRSVKYHRPRGLYSLDGELTNTGLVYYPPICDPWYWWCIPGGVGPGEIVQASKSVTEFGFNGGIGLTFETSP